MPLTDVVTRNAKPRAKQYKLADSMGLYLLVRPDGARYWRFKYRFGGKERLLALGVYPEVSLGAARKKRDEARAKLRDGVDPGVERKAEKQRQRIAAENTFEAVAREWIAKQKERWKPGHAKRVLESLEANLFPGLGKRPVAEITPQELLFELRKIEKRGALEIASRVAQRASSVFRYAIVTARASYNPASDLRGSLTPPRTRNYAALTAADLPEFLTRLDAYDGEPTTKLAIRLLLLTFVRTGELRGARWTELDLDSDAPTWRIPAERMKMKQEHIVPLSQTAVETLRELAKHTGDRPLLFPNRNRPQQPMSENTVLFAIYRMGYHSRATGHGFRATASTILNEMGYKPDVIERQLAHGERNKVRAAYNRAQYLAERREMMRGWADYLAAIAAGGSKVLPIRAIAAAA
jgi:integrase